MIAFGESVCTMCEHVCIHFSSWNIELFIQFRLSRYVCNAIFFHPNLVFYCLFYCYYFCCFCRCCYRRVCANAYFFFFLKSIDFWFGIVDDRYIKTKTTIKNYLFLMHIAHECVAFVGCQWPSNCFCHCAISNSRLLRKTLQFFVWCTDWEGKIIRTSIIFDRFSSHFVINSNSMDSNICERFFVCCWCTFAGTWSESIRNKSLLMHKSYATSLLQILKCFFLECIEYSSTRV